jgi:hypothetical protein
VPGHLSPHHVIPIDFNSLPPPSIIPDIDSTASIQTTPSFLPHTLPTPLYVPTLSDTICDRDTAINTHIHQTTRSDTNSLPKPKHHYNDIHTIMSFISINNTPSPDLSLHSFKHTNYHDLFNFAFLSSPLPSF